MEIVYKDPKLLKNCVTNARAHSEDQIDQILGSIKSYGFNVPIEIDSNNVVISGHARLMAALKLNLDTVPTIRHDHLVEAKKRGYMLAANKIATNASWDLPLLQNEIKFLLDSEENLSLTGFSSEELQTILNTAEEDNIFTAPDDCPELKNETIVIKGDVWQLGRHRLMCGDSTSATDVNELYAGLSPILMITDPPYGVEYDAEWRKKMDNGKRSTGKVLNDDKWDWDEAYTLFTGDIAYIWHGVKFTHKIASKIEELNFKLINLIIWSKPHFQISRGNYHHQFEPCWYAVRNNKNHNWQGSRKQSTLWEINNLNHDEERTGHSTQKPVECMYRSIENNSQAGDWIYDPFGGSGTTLIAAEMLKRNCVMMELNGAYCDMIIRRWEKFTRKKAVNLKTGEEFNGG